MPVRRSPVKEAPRRRLITENIYLDNNATTAVAPQVLEAMMPFFGQRYGNPSSIHRFGGMVRKHIEQAREHVAALLNANPDEITFVSCGSEGDNLALKGMHDAISGQTHIITSTVEHPAVLTTCHHLRDSGALLTEIGVDGEGNLDMEALGAASIDQNTIVSLMWANNETGVLFPISRASALVKSNGGLFHTDAVQAAGKIPIDVKAVPVDMLTISGHKLHAPKGIGAQFIRRKTRFSPLIHGGHQENGHRAGTENVAFIVGLGKACELALAHMEEENTRVRRMRDRLERELLSRCKSPRVNGDPRNRLPNTTNISFEFIEGEAILLMLDEKGIAASSGSACTSGSLEPSHVLRAMGVPYTYAHSSTRFSLSRYTTEEEIDTVIREMPVIVERLRSISPFVKEGAA